MTFSGMCGITRQHAVRSPDAEQEEPVAEEWLTTSEVVKQFKVSDRTVRRAVEDGKLSPARASAAANAKMRFRQSEVEQWLGMVRT
jgi:excisionase family DNA binding protein